MVRRAGHRADEVLRHFFARQARRASDRRQERLAAAEGDLRACLDRMAPLLLDPHELQLVGLERQFDPVGAVARVASAEAVLLLLPVFLDDPHWHGQDLADRVLRIALAEPLAERIAALPDIGDLERGRWLVEAAVRHETWLLRQERAAVRAARSR